MTTALSDAFDRAHQRRAERAAEDAEYVRRMVHLPDTIRLARWVEAMSQDDRGRLSDLVIALGAAVPNDRSIAELVAWADDLAEDRLASATAERLAS